VKLCHTGLDVSRLCLGCMTYGVPERGAHPWTLNEEASRPLIRQALELGINFSIPQISIPTARRRKSSDVPSGTSPPGTRS